MKKVNPLHVLNARHALTYNAVYDAYGEEVMLAYENIVGEYIQGRPANETDIVILSVHITKADVWDTATSDISLLLSIAREHAEKEINQAKRYDVEGPINPDLLDIINS